MSLPFKPHTAAVEVATQRVTSNNIDGRNLAASVNVKCQITPGNSTLIYEQHNIMIDSPYLLMCDVEDAPKFTTGTVVTWNARKFVVEAIDPWEAITEISFASVVLKEQKKA